jgi:preprotein translocase subunit SecY
LQDLVLSPGQPLYLVLFGALIIFFCYFYTALVFSPKEVSENLKRSGAYVPGIRPGEQTARYLDHILNRLTFIGAFTSHHCLMPMIYKAHLVFHSIWVEHLC